MRTFDSSGRSVAAALFVIVAIGAAAVAGAATRAEGAAKKKPPLTHVGQPVAELVVLNLVDPTTTPVFVRCHDDGTRDATEFTVPAGTHLVVTDVDWVASGMLGYFTTLRLFVETGAARCPVALLTDRTDNTSGAGGGSNARTWGSTGIVTGFSAAAGSRIVADIRDVTSAVSSGDALAAFESANVMVVLRGYITRD